jgi:hypothetical protein
VKTRVFIVAAVCALGAPAAAQAAVVPVQQLNGDFGATNSSVFKTPDGVHFGIYANAGPIGGSLEYDGLNGQPFGSLSALGYTYQYNTSDDDPATGGPTTVGSMAAPYLRVFLDSNGDGQFDHDVLFDPTLCATQPVTENEDHAVDVTAQTVRVDDDQCGPAPGTTAFALAQAAHATDTIVGIVVTQGFSGGDDASANVRNLTVNGTTFAFDAPAPPTVVTQTTTRIVQVPVTTTAPAPAPAPAPATGVLGVQVSKSCRGAAVRRIHAPTRRGERFLRVSAALQTPNGLRSLRSSGRTVTVDLRNKPEANYNVRLISRYRTKHGHVRRVVTRRNLSVACS